jgi:hypothetical protein
MQEISGVSGAGPIFHRLFSMLHEKHPASFPAKPDSLHAVLLDTRTGGPAVAGTPPTCLRIELATEADKARLPSGRYDSQGRAILDARYA